ncbi:MAG: acetolactate synthase [Candidatus Omnitrophica bacterium]|nr:acetolactate synthase [Candidatus Omnitrophota bacterium]
MPKKLHVFVENKPGRLESVTEILYKNGINVIAFTIQDRGDFGMLKLLADKPDQAYLVLADKGFACAIKEVMMVVIKDKPGNLYKLTSVLLRHKVNIIDAHGFVIEPGKKGVCCLELAETKGVRQLLEKEGFSLMDEEKLAALLL